jgi:D-alanyl-D-alanine carboxypeptidase
MVMRRFWRIVALRPKWNIVAMTDLRSAHWCWQVGSSLRSLVLIVVSATYFIQPVEAASKHAALVIDANTGAVISQSSADEPRYPASLTKMMTLYVVFDLIEQGRLNYGTRIRFSEAATGVQPTKLGVEPGTEIALIDAIKGLIVKSANDAAVAVAEHIAGTEKKFAALMTQKARQLGMLNTTFKNAHGLPDSEQVTTARDMLTLGLRLQDDFPEHYRLFSTKEFRFGGETYRTHNTMLMSYEGTDGIKTGYTSASGFNLVTNAKRGQKHVLGVVLGGASATSRNQTMRTRLNIALLKGSSVRTRAATKAIRGRPVPEPRPVTRPALVAAAPALRTPPAVPAAPVRATRPQPAVREMASKVETVVASPIVTSNVEIARVRPVLVAPRPPKQAPVPVEAAVVPVSTVAADVPERAAALRGELRTPNFRSFGQSTLVAAASPEPVAVPQLRPSIIAAVDDALLPAQRNIGAAPSTLQQQAQNIARGAQPVATVPAPSAVKRPVQLAMAGAAAKPAYRLNGPAVVDGGVQIQVGAFSTQAEADRQIVILRDKANDLLGKHQGMSIAAQSGGRAVYRARFAGFDAAAAGTVCTELRRRQIDCMVAKAE